jgi:hypothetical protein
VRLLYWSPMPVCRSSSLLNPEAMLINAVKWLLYSDHVIVLSSEGRLLQSGTFHSLLSVPGYLRDLNLEDNGIENAGSVAEPDVNQSNSYPPTPTPAPNPRTHKDKSAEDRGHRDPRNLLYYINTMGKLGFGLFLFFVAMEIVFIALQRNSS